MPSNSSLFVGITIGALFQGGAAFASSKKAISTLGDAIKKLEEHKLTLHANSDEYKQAEARINQLNGALAQLSTNSSKLNDVYAKRDSYKNKILDVAALGYALYKPLQRSIELESAIASVTKVVDFSDPIKGVADFTEEIKKLTRTIPLTATELATIAAAGGQMGITEDKIIGFTELTARMATAFDLSAQETGDAVGKLMNIYSLDIAKTEELGDTINYLTNSMATNPAAVTEIMGRIGGSAKIFGLTTDQAAALSAAFSSLGKSPQVAATSINVLLNKLSTAPQQGKDFQEALEAIGMDAEQLKEAIQQDAQGALNEFLQTLGNVDKADLMGLLTNLFGSGFADDMAVLVGGMAQYDKSLELINDTQSKNGAMQREFNTQAATTANKMTILGNAWSEILIGIGDAIKPTLLAVGSALTWVAQKIAAFVKWLGPVGSVIASVIAGILGLAVVIPVLGYAFTFAHAGAIHFRNALIYLRVSTIGATLATTKKIAMDKLDIVLTKTRAFWTKVLAATTLKARLAIIGAAVATGLHNAAMIAGRVIMIGVAAAQWLVNAALWACPILIIGALFITAVGLIYRYWEPISDFFIGVWDNIKSVFSAVGSFFYDVGYAMVTPLSLAFNAIKFVAGWAWEGIKSVFAPVASFFGSIVNAIAYPFQAFFGWLGSTFGGVWEEIKLSFWSGIDFFKSLLGEWAAPFEAFFGWIADSIGWLADKIGAIIDWFSDDENEKSADKTQLGSAVRSFESPQISETSMFDDSGDSEASGGASFGAIAAGGGYGGASRQISISFGDIYVQNSTEAPAVIAQRIRSAVAYELEDTP
jgi:TP901 family phage tail tape measure protein